MGTHTPNEHAGREVDVLVIGGGQAGLDAVCHLRRAGCAANTRFVILDTNDSAGGSWQHSGTR